jgi:hypothetical protein
VTEQQQLALRIATDLGVPLEEVDQAIRLARTGRVDLIVHVSARRMSIKAALKAARNLSR